jgi:hypothetical protein
MFAFAITKQPSTSHTAQHTVTSPWISNMRSSLHWCHNMPGHMCNSLLPKTLQVMCGQH